MGYLALSPQGLITRSIDAVASLIGLGGPIPSSIAIREASAGEGKLRPASIWAM